MQQPVNPFQMGNYSDADDVALIAQVLEGNQQALTSLMERHRQFIYNVALKMINNVQVAEDVTQEILLKLIVNLGSFDAEKGRFRTWLYRVTFNHILNLQKQRYETLVPNFDKFFTMIENSPVDDNISLEEEVSMQQYIDEARVACMAGMIMCLERGQRLIYIVGEVFEIDHQLGAEIFATSPANFRKRLSRARQDLYQCMTNRCGLVNTANPCRCPKKTKGFIANGWVDAENLKWHSDYQHSIAALSNERIGETLSEIDTVYKELYQAHPFKNYDNGSEVLSAILANTTIRNVFQLSSEEK